MKEKLKSYSFWVSVASAIMAVLQIVFAKLEIDVFNELTTAFLGVLVVAGIIDKPKGENDTPNVNTDEDNNQIDEG